MSKSELAPADYERNDLRTRSVLVALPATLLALVVFILLARWIYPHAVVDRRLPNGVPSFPRPQLQSDPGADMQRFLATELGRLNGTGWDDPSKGEGHISIDQAMRHVAEEGIKDWPR